MDNHLDSLNNEQVAREVFNRKNEEYAELIQEIDELRIQRIEINNRIENNNNIIRKLKIINKIASILTSVIILGGFGVQFLLNFESLTPYLCVSLGSFAILINILSLTSNVKYKLNNDIKEFANELEKINQREDKKIINLVKAKEIMYKAFYSLIEIKCEVSTMNNTVNNIESEDLSSIKVEDSEDDIIEKTGKIRKKIR